MPATSGTICSYLGTIVSLDEWNRLEQCKLLKNGCSDWKLQTVLSHNFSTHGHHVVKLDTAYNARSGKYEIYALCVDHSKCSLHLSCFDASLHNSLDIPVKFPNSSASDWITKGTLMMCSGPSVIGFSPDTLCISFPLFHYVEPFTLSTSQLAHGQNVICNVWSFDWTGKSKLNLASVLLVIKFRCLTSVSDTQYLFRSILINLNSTDLKYTQVSETIIPQEYAAIIKCMSLNWKLCIDPVTAAPLMSPEFIIGTSYNQVVVIEAGTITHCIDIGGIPSLITTVQVAAGKGTVIVCQLAAEDKLTKTVSLQYTSQQTWERKELNGDCEMFVGNFTGMGNEQLLMLMRGDFVILDFDGMQYDSREHVQLSSSSGDDASNALKTALTALQVRKLRGETQLDSARRTLQKKCDMFSYGLKLLKQINEYQEEHTTDYSQIAGCDQSLLCIVPGNIESTATARTASVEQNDSSLQLSDSWQRIVDSQWVIGVSVKNVSSSINMHGLSFSILPLSDLEQVPVACKSRIVIANPTHRNTKVSARDDCGPLLKKIRMENPEKYKKSTGASKDSSAEDALRESCLSCQGSACFIISTSLPNFFTTSVDVAVIVSWHEGNDTDNLCIRSKQLCCLSLAASDVCSKKLQVSLECLQYWTGSLFLTLDEEYSSSHRDLACLLGCRDVTKIKVSSSHTSLICLPVMLRSRLPHHVTVLGGNSAIPVTAPSSSSTTVLDGIVIHCMCRPCEAVLSIMHSSHQQLSLLLQLLYTTLPHDVQCIEQDTDQAALASGLKSLRARILNTLADD